MHGRESPPISDRLVVNNDIRLGEKARKATLDSEVACSGPRIFGTDAAPTVELSASARETPHMFDYFGMGMVFVPADRTSV